MNDPPEMVYRSTETLDGAVCIEAHKDKRRNPATRLEKIHVLLGAYKDGNTIYPVQFEIKEYKDMDNKLYVAITIKKSEIVDSISTNVDNASNSDNYTVSQLIELINPNASSFLKYFPNQMLSSDQLIGKRKGIEYDIENYDPLE